MYPPIKKTFAIICILVCHFNVAKAQLASNRSLSQFYNNNTKEKLAEINTSKRQTISPPKKQNLASRDPLLKDIPNKKIKNPGIVLHKDAPRSIGEKKKNLPGNSAHLKQLGYPMVKH
jgi:hypothetical protein